MPKEGFASKSKIFIYSPYFEDELLSSMRCFIGLQNPPIIKP